MSLLRLANISAFYGPSQALFDVTFRVEPGEVLALMGRNGMGKTTTIKVICRMLKHRGGSLVFDGQDLARWPSHKAARAGGQQVLGYFHSHPQGHPVPSATDCDHASGDDRVWAIVAGGEVAFWRDGEGGFSPVEWDEVD